MSVVIDWSRLSERAWRELVLAGVGESVARADADRVVIGGEEEMVISFGPVRLTAEDRARGREFVLAARERPAKLPKAVEYWPPSLVVRRAPAALWPRLVAAAGDGDILGEVAGPLAADLTHFLEAELLADLYSRLESINSDPERRIPLARVFVDLPTGEDVPFCAEVLGSDVRFLPDQTDERHLLLIGGPGQGKTTLGQYLCQLHRAALLEPRMHLLGPDAQGQVLPLRAPSVPRPHQVRFPLRVPLHRFAAELDLTAEDPLWTWLLGRFAMQIERAVDATALRVFLESFPVLLVFDGLDEVPSSANRAEVVRALARFLDGFAKDRAPFADVVAVATTRPQGYRGEFSWTQRVLRPLKAKQASVYADQLIRERNRTDKERQRTVAQRFQRALTDPRAAALTRSPLQVTILCALLERQGQAPRLRWRLFRDYFRVIYDRERDREIPAAAILNEQETLVHRLHWEAGFLLHVRSEVNAGPDASFSRLELAAVVDRLLADRGFAAADAFALRERIVEAALLRLVFLVGVEEERVGFEIRSLQEFAAAEHIAAAEGPLVARRLTAIMRTGHWRNVFAFVAGRGEADHEPLAAATMAVVEAAGEVAPVLAAELLAEGVGASAPARRAILLDRACAGLRGPHGDRIVEVLAEEVPDRVTGAERLGVRAWKQAADHHLLISIHALDPEDVPRVLPRHGRQADVDAVFWQYPPRCWMTRMSEFRAIPTDFPLYHRPNGLPARPIRQPRRFAESYEPFLGRGWRWIPLAWAVNDSAVPAGAHPEWGSLDAAAAFCRTPSKESLAAALASIDPKSELRRWIANEMPWPLASLVWRTGVVDLAERVRRGHFGDVDDWRQAEDRWLYDENEKDWVSVNLTAFPYDATVGMAGPPPRGSLYVSSKGVATQRLRELWRQSGGLDRALNFWMHQDGDLPSADDSIWLGVVETGGYQLLAAAGEQHAWADPWPSLLGALLEKHRRISWNFPVAGALLHRCPGSPGLVALAAGNVRAGRQVIVSAESLPPLGDDLGLAADVLLLRLTQPEPDAGAEAELRRLLPLVETLAEDVLSAAKAAPAEHYDHALRTALEVAPTLIRNRMIEELADRLAARASGLADPRVATALELPLLPGAVVSSPPGASALEPARVIRLHQLELIDFKGHAQLRVERPIGENGQWTVFLGDNGVGKTSILRAIAFALLPPEIGQAWVASLPPPIVRIGAGSNTAKVTLHLADTTWTFDLSAGKVADGARPSDLFLAGYGPHRGSVHSGSAEPEYTPRWAVATLFDDGATLTHPERWLKDFGYRATELKGADGRFFDALRVTLATLLPGVERIEVTSSEVARVHGPGFGGVPLTALSDGYLTTAAWILDLVARWAAWARARKMTVDGDFAARMTGLVLIDEIDLHLHPQWQRELIHRVRAQFPNLSFVATTHNPITLLGTRPGEVCVLRRADSGVVATFRDVPPGADADRVLTGDWFGLISTIDDETLRLVDERRMLLRSDATGPRVEEVRLELERRLGHRQGGAERLVESVAAELLTEETGTLTQEELATARAKLLARSRARRSKG